MIGLVFQNYYQRLGLERTASQEQVKSAFRKQARVHHPDLATDKVRAHKAFLLIKEAYDTLSAPDKRQDYDQLLDASNRFKQKVNDQKAAKEQRTHTKAAPPPPPKKRATSSQSQQRKQSQPRRDTQRPPREDLHVYATLEISLEDAIKGGIHTITLEKETLKNKNHTFQSIEISIPQNCHQGRVLSYPRRGLKDKLTGEYGTLFLTIEFQRHASLRLLGSDLYTSVDVYPWDAALGSFIAVNTLRGIASLKLEPGSQPWQSFRLKGYGMPNEDTTMGDLIVSLRFLQPPALDPEQIQTWKSLKNLYTRSGSK